MIELDVQYNDAELKRFLNALPRNFKINDRGFTAIRGIMIRSIDQNFDAEGRPNKWKSLAESTIKLRRHGKKKKLGTKILQNTGMLKNSIDAIREGDKILISTKTDYGKYHQEGKGVPARPFLMFQDEDITKITNAILESSMGDIK